MAMMCSTEGCVRKSGLCGHEKIMLVVMAMGMVGGAAYWLLG